jgi:hypothetical protein
MRRGTGRWPAALLATALLAGPAAAQAPRVVTFTGQVVEASNPPRPQPNDPAVVAALPSGPFQQFTQYKSLGTFNGTAAVGRTYSVTLRSGATAITVEATPKAADAKTITVDVRLLRDGSLVVGPTVRLTPGGQVGVGGAITGGGALLLLLSGR